jgi:hypothetical protein
MGSKQQRWTRKKLHRIRLRAVEARAEEVRRDRVQARKAQRTNRRVEAMLKDCAE